MKNSGYIIRGGVEGRERLRVLARIMQPTSLDLLRRVGIRPGMTYLEVGCGGGDLAFDMARMVAPSGSVVGSDIDEKKVEIASREAEEQGLKNIEFRLADIRDSRPAGFDLVHARFVLTHLANPAQALGNMRGALQPGGVIVLEDIDFRGHFCYPECPALWRFVQLYTEAVRRKGGDANIGPRLPILLSEAGFEKVQLNVVQPAGTDGEIKLITPLTMENIAGALVDNGLALTAEVDQIVAELYAFGQAPGTVVSLPRIVQAWGYRSNAPN
jgi:SAM-dependent methyltransferase